MVLHNANSRQNSTVVLTATPTAPAISMVEDDAFGNTIHYSLLWMQQKILANFISPPAISREVLRLLLYTSATLNATVSNDGGSSPQQRFYYGTTNPTGNLTTISWNN
jgi:hypothetical protein